MRDLVWIPITQAAFRRISLDVFGHLLDLDHAFHLHRKTGQIMRILDRGTSSIQDTVSIVLFNVIPQLIDIVVACTYLAVRMQPWAAVIVFITVASYVPLTVIITERRGVIRKRMNALDNAREGRATDMLLNYETVKYFCNERFELAGYDNATRQYQAAEYWQMAFLAMLSITQASVVWLGLAAGMVVCVRGVVGGSLTVGDAVLFVTMMNQLYVPLTFFGSYYRQVQKALIDMENMFELLDTEPGVQDSPGAGRLVVREARVDFQRVVFAYSPASPPVLKGVSFTVPGGKTLAVVGATGSGKSTILRLLLRFYDPSSGRVLFDGQDIRGVTQESLRRAIAVVPQDTVMFNDTVLYNIRYGRTEATDEEVTEAASVAHIHTSIVTTFKKGYSTRVGERGLRLSGGEKQRVAFARAVLKRPALLILDEATSALDSLTELAIQSSLQTLRSRCTTVIVAHRLSTIMDADLILVLDRGEVAQCGSHSELMEEGGLYAAMWTRQQDTGAAGYTTPLIHHTSLATGPAPTAVASTTTQRHNSEPPSINLSPRPNHHNGGGGGGGGGAGAVHTAALALHRGGISPAPPPPSAAAAARLGVAVNGGGGGGGREGGGGGGRSPGTGAGGGNGGGGGLPRVPSRLMRRAFLNEEMSESGEQGAVSRNPTPRRSRAPMEDEANERLYEDREVEDPADTPAMPSPSTAPSPAAAPRPPLPQPPPGRFDDAGSGSPNRGPGSGGEGPQRPNGGLHLPDGVSHRPPPPDPRHPPASSPPPPPRASAGPQQPAALERFGSGSGGSPPATTATSAFATPAAAAAVLIEAAMPQQQQQQHQPQQQAVQREVFGSPVPYVSRKGTGSSVEAGGGRGGGGAGGGGSGAVSPFAAGSPSAAGALGREATAVGSVQGRKGPGEGGGSSGGGVAGSPNGAV
ncbi:hypothetical protein Agub_g727 [Astrephomene gubernaculifera]|uniref:Uncharacterized protein n=1 Tax=Astrephomene gubernaculifera TaxID=47775 RepID=A0AAD3DE96_9CHLO|nr:hypothetical protein Agub_g727 [Astrephomene gubernaculifera]